MSEREKQTLHEIKAYLERHPPSGPSPMEYVTWLATLDMAAGMMLTCENVAGCFATAVQEIDLARQEQAYIDDHVGENCDEREKRP